MKVRTFFLYLIFVAAQAFATDFQTLDGTKYKDVMVKRVEADGIVVVTDVGVEKIYFNELPKEIQERYRAQARARVRRLPCRPHHLKRWQEHRPNKFRP